MQPEATDFTTKPAAGRVAEARQATTGAAPDPTGGSDDGSAGQRGGSGDRARKTHGASASAGTFGGKGATQAGEGTSRNVGRGRRLPGPGGEGMPSQVSTPEADATKRGAIERSDGHAQSIAVGAAEITGREPARPLGLNDLVGIVAVEVQAQTRRIEELELALADAEARILSQARLICGATMAAEGDLFNRRPVREIVEDVLSAYPGIRWEEIIGVGRERRLVEPRHRCMAAVYEERADLSLPALGRIFRRDHTSVLHAVNKPGNRRAATR